MRNYIEEKIIVEEYDYEKKITSNHGADAGVCVDTDIRQYS